ncbi:MAG TPA: hypothetical protein PK990_06725 [Salinivirgaceae bacterium]|nr:hypothetical protein [Salinivirgaceae bacterium]
MKSKLSILSIIQIIVTSAISQDFEVSPVKLLFNAEPGSTQVKNLVVKNHSSQSQSYIVSVGDFTINNSGNREFAPAGSNKRSVSNWLTITPTFFELPPNQEQQIAVSIQPPIDEFGSRWGVLYIRPTVEKKSFQADKTLSAGMTLSPQIVVEVYQTALSSSAALSVKIDQFREIESDSQTERKFSAIVTNNSDIIVECRAFLILSDIKTGEEKIFPPSTFATFPKTSQRIILSLPRDYPKGTYALAAVLDYGNTQTLEGAQIIIEF